MRAANSRTLPWFMVVLLGRMLVVLAALIAGWAGPLLGRPR